jgi:hypothetical protein
VHRASQARRSVAEEARQILADSLQVPSTDAENYPLPELIPSEEISSPCDLPRPGNAQQTACVDGGQRLPDTLLGVEGEDE